MIRRMVEVIKLDATAISNKTFSLSHNPTSTAVECQIGHAGYSALNYSYSFTAPNTISWTGYSWETVLEAGDIIIATYQYDDGADTPAYAKNSLTSIEKSETFIIDVDSPAELKLRKTPVNTDAGSIVTIKVNNAPVLIPKATALSAGDYDYYYVNDANGPRIVLQDSEVTIGSMLKRGDYVTVFYEYAYPSESNQKRTLQVVLDNAQVANRQLKLPYLCNVANGTSFDLNVYSAGSIIRGLDYKAVYDAVFWVRTELSVLAVGDVIDISYHTTQ